MIARDPVILSAAKDLPDHKQILRCAQDDIAPLLAGSRARLAFDIAQEQRAQALADF